MPHQSPILEFTRFLNFAKSHGRLHTQEKLKIGHRELRIFRIWPSLANHFGDANDGRLPATVVNKYVVSWPHFTNSANGLRIANSVP